MNTPPFFSVIIPTYNRADLVGKAIDSVLKQSFDNLELIVVDDGSTDKTAGIVKGFKDDRVRYIYQTNAERSAARNNGIAHATGKYVCFLDSDDYYLPERLKLLYEEMISRNCPIEMFYTGLLIEKEGNVYLHKGDARTTDNAFDNLVATVIHSQQACISREILQEFKYDRQFRIGEDMELWFRIVKKYPVTYLDNQFTIVVLNHEDRSVNVKKYNSGAEQLKLYRYILSNEHSGKKISEKIKRFMLAGAYHSIARYHVHQDHRFASVIAILKAIIVGKRSDWLKLRINIFLKLITFLPMEKVKELIGYH